MLSPGQWHKKVPKEPRENLRFRKFLLEKARNDKPLQRAICEVCKQDLLFYVSVFIFQANFKERSLKAKLGPFITWEFQDEAFLLMLDCIEKGKDLLIEKSRQMGASWMLCILFEWLWRFHRDTTLLFISRSAPAVEDESPNSLFWKIDFFQRYIPDWMLSVPLRRRKMYFGNDALNSHLFGEASTGQANVGGNTTAMGIDEFSQIKEAAEVNHRTSDSTPCRIFNGTHLGQGTEFFALSQRPDIRKLKIHWTQHPIFARGLYRWDPLKNQVVILDKTYKYAPDFKFVMSEEPKGGPFPGLRSPWYDEQCERKGNKRAIAMDLDIDPGGSVTQFFDSIIIRALRGEYARDPVWEGDLEYDRDSAEPHRLVPRQNGTIKLWVNPTPEGLIVPGTYTMGTDVSTGIGATPSCCSIIDAATGEKIGKYVNAHIEPTPMAVLGVALCRLFKTEDGVGALWAWECPGPGQTMGKRVLELNYQNIYWRSDETKPLIGQQRLPAQQPGWYTSLTNKLTLLEEYRAGLNSRLMINRADEDLQEALKFEFTATGYVEHAKEKNEDDFAMSRVNHGDMVIADALAWKMARGKGAVIRKREENRIPSNSLAARRLEWQNRSRELQESWD